MAPGRSSKWPTAAETRYIPPTQLNSMNIDDHASDGAWSMQADKEGLRSSHRSRIGYQLADWSGNWAPAPEDWDDRPMYEDPVLMDRIKQWQMRIENDVVPIAMTRAEFKAHDGEICPHSWVLKTIGEITIDAWWRENLRSPHVTSDVAGLPYWKMFSGPEKLMRWLPLVAPLDRNDHDAHEWAQSIEQTSETSSRSKDVRLLKKQNDLRKAREERRRWQREQQAYVPQPNEHSPRANIYIRPAKAADMPQIRDLYNHWINTSLACPEMEPLTNPQMLDRWCNITETRLPFLVAADRSAKVARKRLGSTSQAEAGVEKIAGLAFADDYQDAANMYRFTVEMEMFVHKDYLRLGVGRTLLDKMMQSLDPQYISKGGYDFVATNGNELDYINGGRRMVDSILINVPYDTMDKSKLVWLQDWLRRWDFEQAGEYFEIGRKMGKKVNLAIFSRKTGSKVDEWGG